MTSSAKDLQFRELKDTMSELNKTNRALLETITVLNKRIAEMAQEHDNQKEQIDFLQRNSSVDLAKKTLTSLDN